MNCNQCGKAYTPDGLDSDGLCFECANDDPDYNPDMTDIVRKFVEEVLHKLADAKDVSVDKLVSDFVAEHVVKHPEKVIKHMIETPAKKKTPPAQN